MPDRRPASARACGMPGRNGMSAAAENASFTTSRRMSRLAKSPIAVSAITPSPPVCVWRSPSRLATKVPSAATAIDSSTSPKRSTAPSAPGWRSVRPALSILTWRGIPLFPPSSRWREAMAANRPAACDCFHPSGLIVRSTSRPDSTTSEGSAVSRLCGLNSALASGTMITLSSRLISTS